MQCKNGKKLDILFAAKLLSNITENKLVRSLLFL